MADIFISYANADRERARQLADALTHRGYAVWWDRTIPPGRVFDEVIQEAIQGARCMIVLWSADSVRSNWVKTEAAEGVARGILVPALIGEVAPPIEFKRIQSANLAVWDGDETHGEYRNLLESVERLMKQTPSAMNDAPRTVQAHRPVVTPSPATSYLHTIKTFAFGALITLVAVGGYWLLAKPAQEAVKPAAVTGGSAPAAAPAAPAASATASAKPAPRGRINLLSAEQGGQLLAASSDRWNAVIDGKEETYVWADAGFGVFGFRDGKTALIDTFAVLIPGQSDNNLKEFELFAGNASITGPFESIGRFTTQNVRIMQSPYQAFTFPPVKAKYLKLQSLKGYDGRTSAVMMHEIQLFGELQ